MALIAWNTFQVLRCSMMALSLIGSTPNPQFHCQCIGTCRLAMPLLLVWMRYKGSFTYLPLAHHYHIRGHMKSMYHKYIWSHMKLLRFCKIKEEQISMSLFFKGLIYRCLTWSYFFHTWMRRHASRWLAFWFPQHLYYCLLSRVDRSVKWDILRFWPYVGSFCMSVRHVLIQYLKKKLFGYGKKSNTETFLMF